MDDRPRIEDPMADQHSTPGDELTYALIHGGGDVAWAWHLVEAELRARGRRTVAIDLPLGPEVGLEAQATAVVDAVGDAGDAVVVCHSFGGFVGPIVADRLKSTRLLVFVAGMVPRPGEAPSDWWAQSGWSAWPRSQDDRDEVGTFYQDVDPALAHEALARGRSGELRGLEEPWPLDAVPAVPIRHLLFRQDRFFPADFMRAMVSDRLGIVPDELDGGHCAMLSRPRELALYLERAVAETAGSRPRLPT